MTVGFLRGSHLSVDFLAPRAQITVCEITQRGAVLLFHAGISSPLEKPRILPN